MSPRRASAVVVRWRGGEEVDRCLQSLLRHRGRDLERVVLVDSGSADGGAERSAAAFPDVTVVALDSNRSFAFAANEGVARTDSPCLLLLHPDTEATDGAFDALDGALAKRPHPAGVVPLLVGADGVPQHRWQLLSMEPDVVVDLGAGTGQATIALKRRYPGGRVVAMDIAHGMLLQARPQVAPQSRTGSWPST